MLSMLNFPSAFTVIIIMFFYFFFFNMLSKDEVILDLEHEKMVITDKKNSEDAGGKQVIHGYINIIHAGSCIMMDILFLRSPSCPCLTWCIGLRV